MGASLGGLSALHAHWRHPGVFAGLHLASGSFFTTSLDPQESGLGTFGQICRAVEDYASQEPMRTVPVGITLYQGEYAFPWAIISAAIILGVLPLVILIIFFQKRIISGLTAGGVKG